MSITNEQELAKAIARAKAVGTDYDKLELKRASGGFPESASTISAFSNAHGGTIVYGIPETSFKPIKDLDIKEIQNGCANAARNDVTPEVPVDIQLIDYENVPVVVANVPEADLWQKPVYVRSKGQREGSFIRVGDGDHKLTSYEIDRLKENATGTLGFDRKIVKQASVNDLENESVARWIDRERRNDRDGTARLSDNDLLITRGALAADENGVLRPTLAGLMCFGIYPQQYFPMLRITFAQFPTDLGFREDIEAISNEEWSESRYERKTLIEGSIPVMVSKALSELNASMGHRGVLIGSVMSQIPQYPLDAIREGVANALMHRDYSPAGSAIPVKIELRPHSLTIRNPGGLFGSMTEDMLGLPGGIAYRNQTMARILENVTYVEKGTAGAVVEALGTGYRTIFRSLSDSQLPRPSIRSSLREFVLRMASTKLATAVEHDKSEKGNHVVSQRKIRRDKIEGISKTYDYLRDNGPSKSRDVAEAIGVSKATAVNYLNQLVDDGKVDRLGSKKSPNQVYQLHDDEN